MRTGEIKPQDGSAPENNFRVSLFDPNGLPWTSSLSWGWILFLTLATAGLLAVPLGIYLGLWIRTKGKSALVLAIYIALAVLVALACLPLDSAIPEPLAEAADLMTVILWLGGAYILRYQVIRYYSDREGIRFRINPFLTALLTVWYINGCLRADFPLDHNGKLPEGILKLRT